MQEVVKLPLFAMKNHPPGTKLYTLDDLKQAVMQRNPHSSSHVNIILAGTQRKSNTAQLLRTQAPARLISFDSSVDHAVDSSSECCFIYSRIHF